MVSAGSRSEEKLQHKAVVLGVLLLGLVKKRRLSPAGTAFRCVSG
jgi:hypothetical protein